MVDASTLTLTTVIIVVSVLLITFLLYTRQLLKRKGQQLRLELDERPEAKGDRAFNQIRIASTEADLLERGGVEVTHARELLATAQQAFDRGDPDNALRSARSAHESLVALRARAPHRLPSVGSPARSPDPRPATPRPSAAAMPALLSVVPPATRDAAAADAGVAPSGESSGGRLPKNRAEAHFQLTLLTEEIGRSGTDPRDGTATSEAARLRADAESAYGRGDFTEALRLALRGRRRIGGHLETLPPSKGIPSGPADPTSGPSATTGSAPTASTCPRCGKGVRASDRFCRGCGATLVSATCPRCRQPVQPEDAFCPACGAPVAP